MSEASYTRPDGAKGSRIEFPDSDVIEEAIVTIIAPGLVRLEESPLFSDFASYGDVIEVDTAADGLLVCRRVSARSGLQVYSFITSHAFLESAGWATAKERLIALGGMWQQTFGGCITLHIPLDSIATFDEILHEAKESARRRAE